MSDQVQVEITGMVITNRYGSLSSGTVLRTDAVFAKHLVVDCGAAKYIVAAQDGASDVVVKAAPKAKAKKKESDQQLEAAAVPPAAEASPIVEPSASEVAQPAPALNN